MILEAAALVLALIGMPVVLWAARFVGVDTLSWRARGLLWATAACVVAFVFAADPQRPILQMMGADAIGVPTILWGIGGAAAVLAASGIVVALQRIFHLPCGDRETFDRAAARPVLFRMFLVSSAAVLEELLYRGVAIGVGARLIGSEATAAIVSCIAFTLGHARWKLAHLPTVAAAGAVLTFIFVVSGDLWACVLAHFLVDALGMIVAPAMMNARRTTKL